MSKTIRNNPESTTRADRDEAPAKQKVPTPYPPVEPTVAQRRSEQKDH